MTGFVFETKRFALQIDHAVAYCLSCQVSITVRLAMNFELMQLCMESETKFKTERILYEEIPDG